MSATVHNNASTAIPDNDPAGVDLTYVVSGAPDCIGVRFSIYLTHDFPGSLTLDLQHPDGTTVRIFDRVNAGDPDIGTSTTQADRATFTSEYPPRPSVNSGGGPWVGTWQPSAGDMQRAFAGKSANGTWTLTITDTDAGITGTHHNSSLFIDTGSNDFVDSGLEFHITGLWYPDAESVTYYGRVADPTDGRVEIPLNNSRSAQVSITTDDPLIDSLVDGDGRFKTYARLLKVYYRKRLVFWGPINLIEGGLGDGSLKISAVDQSVRLIHHFARRGDFFDDELTLENDDKATVPIDHRGLRWLRDAGLNTADQTTRGVPDLGIIDGRNDVADEEVLKLGLSRGDQVWDLMIQLTQSLGPDMELDPLEGTVGAYCQLNTFNTQGDDISAQVAFHYGTGKQNVDDLSFVDGSKYITHAHVLSRGGEIRVTSADAESSAETGPYVEWDAPDFDAHPVFTGGTDYFADSRNVLAAYGQDILKAYGRPLLTVTLTLPIEDASSYQYGRDYRVGDTVGVAARRDRVDLEPAAYRITTVRLVQANADNAIRPEIEVVPDRVSAYGDGVADTEE